MTLADDLTQVWDAARPVFAESFHADTYELIRAVRVPDGYGGSTTEPQVVESGRCALDVSNRLGDERVTGGVVTATANYTAELPIDADVKPDDTLRINGRTFEITDVGTGGHHALFTVVSLEARS